MNRSRSALAVALVLLIGSAHALHADVRADQKNLVKFEGMLGRIVNIFGGKAAKDGVKSIEAVKGDRKASLTDTTGQIVDLAEEKIYDLDLKKKTYKVTTFDELRRRMAEARRKAEEEQRKADAEAKKQPDASSDRPPDQSGKEIEVDFDVKETGQRKTINGFDTRQVVMTIAMREKGRTLEESGGLVITADSWLTPVIAAMKELAEFNIRYAKQLAGPMFVGASPEEMASAIAMYPGMQEGLARMRAEGTKLDGTPILTVVTVESVKSAEQMAELQTSQSSSSSSSSGGTPTSVGGLVGGLMKKAAPKPAPPKQRGTVMTMNNEVLKVTTDVPAADVAIPSGFKETK